MWFYVKARHDGYPLLLGDCVGDDLHGIFPICQLYSRVMKEEERFACARTLDTIGARVDVQKRIVVYRSNESTSH